MSETLLLVAFIIGIAFIFDFTNGFHDAANAIATSVATRALTPRAALTMAAQYNSWIMVLTGAVLGMIVADSLGILVGIFLNRRLPAKKMRYLSAAIFLLFGVVGLGQCLF